MFRSGNIEHPEDRFSNTTVEVLPFEAVPADIGSATAAAAGGSSMEFNVTSDGYVIVAAFDQLGVAEGSIASRLGKIQEIRLRVHGEAENWVILNEVWLKGWIDAVDII